MFCVCLHSEKRSYSHVLPEKLKSFRSGSIKGEFLKNGPTPAMPRFVSSPTSAKLVALEDK